MASAVNKPLEVGLVLQGGGALGAYECGAATRLLELMHDATRHRQVMLKAVNGVSIGAVNGACIVGSADWADARARLEALWDDLAFEMPSAFSFLQFDLSALGGPDVNLPRDLSLWGLPGFYAPRQNLLSARNWTSYYDTTPFLATLERHIDFSALNASATRFAVSAVNVKSGVLTRFRNYPLTSSEIRKASPRPAQRDLHCQIGPQHILASGSLPPQFPWTMIDGQPYWDGGLVDNTPIGEVMDAFSIGDEVERVLVVMNVYPLRAARPQNLAEVEDRKHELCFGNHLRQDRETAERINKLAQTVQDLAELAQDRLTPELQAQVHRVGLYKVVKTIEIDLQHTQGADERSAPDNAAGLRDFSKATVMLRRERGRKYADGKLRGVFSPQSGDELERKTGPISSGGR